MDTDEHAGARVGQPGDTSIVRVDDNSAGRDRSRFAQVGGYLARSLVSAGALVCAGLVVAGLGQVVAPLPDRGLASPAAAVIAAPAALPTVPEPESSGATVAPPPAAAPAEPPVELPAQETPQVAFSAWASRVAPVTGIPQRALQAYANAHAAMAATQPGCQLTWVTLAGIARVESDHGRIGGRTMGPDGRPSAPIIGVPLNGAPGVRSIADTDRGLLDTDPVWDRAVGPFQFIPSTWVGWASDGDGDGIGEPQDIDDAAIGAARYLCAGGRDLATGDGWLGAILSYNDSVEYVQRVYVASQEYARSAQGIS